MTLSKAIEIIVEEEQEKDYICPLGLCDGDQLYDDGDDCPCVSFNKAEKRGEEQFELERGN